MIRSRRGYTLVELAICLAILAVASAVVLPALTDLGRSPPRRTAGELVSLLQDSRRIAIDSNVDVTVLLEPTSGDYRVDSMGVHGTGVVWEGVLDMTNMETLATEAPRLRYFFHPTGTAIGDTVRVQGSDSSMVLWVDPWNGVTHVGN